ncbi:MAG: adenylate/guanylate cyclase domain-containing protein [Candidatus Melainabacteria bacterium]
MGGTRQPSKPAGPAASPPRSGGGFCFPGRPLSLLLGLILLVRFVAMIFFPGSPATMHFFESILPYWPTFSSVTSLLTAPISAVSNLIAPALPPELKVLYPTVGAAPFLQQFISNLTPQQLSLAFPGKVEWESLIAIPFWWVVCVLLTMACQVFRSVLGQMNLPNGAARKPAGKAQTRQEPPKKTAPPPARQEKRDSPLKGQAGENSLFKDRLKKIQPGQLPDIPVDREEPGQRESLDDFRKREADLGVRQMMSDLRKENIHLKRQEQQLRSTISQYFSPKVFQYLEANRNTFQNMQNQKREVSILFCDVRNFSSFSQHATPEEINEFLGEYFLVANDVIINMHEGCINKLMGDGIMAYWGFPIPNTEHAYEATMAARGILKEIELCNRTTRQSNKLEVGIGIATGEVMIGNVGSSDFKDFTLIGNPVNLASRLDAANKDLGTSLLICPETHRKLQGRIACRDRGNIAIKGWTDGIQVFEPKL